MGLLLAIILVGIPAMAVQAAQSPGGGQSALTQAEIDGLRYMREEEKLAHDVYVVMNDQYRVSIFSCIAMMETRHMAAIKSLLDRYGLSDPVAGNGIGVFTNPGLQDLYNTLVDRGNASLSEALKVGGAIEDINIRDLGRNGAAASHNDISSVFTHLIRASSNHLRMFVSTLQRTAGETYQPQSIDLRGQPGSQPRCGMRPTGIR